MPDPTDAKQIPDEQNPPGEATRSSSGLEATPVADARGPFRAISKGTEPHLTITLPAEMTAKDFLSLSVEESVALLNTALAPEGFSLDPNFRLKDDDTRFGYADLVCGTGPSEQQVVAKFIGANSRDETMRLVFPYNNLEKDFVGLSAAKRAEFQEFPDLLVEVRFHDGELAAVVMEKIEFASGQEVINLVRTADTEKRADMHAAVLSLYDRAEKQAGLKAWDFQLEDLVYDTSGKLRIVDAGSFLPAEGPPGLPANVKNRFARIFGSGSFQQTYEDLEESA
ncbi:MAG: hypothetical protein KDD70_09875 [Bdellovibrionales bacterium]|nr:hypothetical protein [Bdellovibrionales bacterium]